MCAFNITFLATGELVFFENAMCCNIIIGTTLNGIILHILQNATNKLIIIPEGPLVSMLHSSQVGRLGLIHLYNLHFIDLAQLSCFTHWWGSEVCLM